MKMIFSILLFATSTLSAATPQRYIVEYTDAATPALHSDARVRVHRQFAHVLRGAAIELAPGTSIEAIARLPHVARVSIDAEVSAYETNTNSSDVVARDARSLGSGKGIVVAVIDSGIDRNHPALAGRVIGGYDFVNDDADPMDDHRHGTHVAGIIAASSSEVSGVAPDVKLLAYKVLDHTGHGVSSDIIAALDRALDPNNDGDTSDHADVVNLSLGAPGHPDDPVSRAVERAVAAGVVVCVAAGNEGAYHRVGSPGVAASAITVGAIDDSFALAEFSSRGPAARSGAIKPDVVAPGVSILSTFPNGQYGRSSGTSMATPYVAGLAALLLEAHPDWTPARVKSALVTTALPIVGERAMAQGSGRVALARAMANDVVITPTQVNFGLDGTLAPQWTSTRPITLRNASASTRTMHLHGDAVTITPDEVTLAPNETREVSVRIDVNHATLGRPGESLSFDGEIAIEWNGGDAHVPWAFVRAGRAIVTYPGAFPAALFDVGARYGSFSPAPDGVEALLEPGPYDLVVTAERDGDARLFVFEQQQIAGEVAYALTPELAPHEIALAGVDDRGLPFEKRVVRARVLLPGSSSMLPSFRTLHATPFSNRYTVLAIESAFDEASHTLYVVQHAPVAGLTAPVTLRNASTEYAAQDVRLRFPDAKPRMIQLMPRDWPRRAEEFGPASPAFETESTSDAWSGRVLMTREHDALDFVGGVQMGAYTGELPQLITPMLRRDANGFFTSWTFARVAVPEDLAPGETLDLGATTVHPSEPLIVTANGIGGMFNLRGTRGEVRRDLAATYRVFNDANEQVAAGNVAYSSFFAQLPAKGKHHAEVITDAGKLQAIFDTTRPATLPAITSMSVLDGTGRHTSRLPIGGNAALVFATTHSNVSVFFRPLGRNTWVELSVVRIAEDEHYGFVHRVDLEDALRFNGTIELAVEVTDGDGNWISWVAPAFSASAARRRPSRP